MKDNRGETVATNLIAAQAALDNAVQFFTHINPSSHRQEIAQKMNDTIVAYHQTPPTHRLQIEINEKAAVDLRSRGLEFIRTINDGGEPHYVIVVKAPLENFSNMPQDAIALELCRKDISPTGPSAFEFMTVRRNGFDHGPTLWPENILSMKIVANATPLPGKM